MAPRVKGPRDPLAAAAADNELYQRHNADARPNALYDAAGNRRRITSDDPTQEEARTQWLGLYHAHGGRVEECPPNPARPGEPVQACYEWTFLSHSKRARALRDDSYRRDEGPNPPGMARLPPQPSKGGERSPVEERTAELEKYIADYAELLRKWELHREEND